MKIDRHFLENSREGLAIVREKDLAVEENLLIKRELVNATRVAIVAVCPWGKGLNLVELPQDALADITVVGNLDDAAGPASILETLRVADRGEGVLLLMPSGAGNELTQNIVLKKVAEQKLNAQCVNVPENGTMEFVALLKLANCYAQAEMPLAELCTKLKSEQQELYVVRLDEDALAQMKATEAAESLLQHLKLEAGTECCLWLNCASNECWSEALALLRECLALCLEHSLIVSDVKLGAFCTTQNGAGVELAIIK